MRALSRVTADSLEAVHVALLVAVSAAALPAGSGQALAVPAPPAGYTLVFSDDFNGAAWSNVDTTRWQFATGHGYPGGAGNWGTGEVETMTANNANARSTGRAGSTHPR